jgi:hypothetical protein
MPDQMQVVNPALILILLPLFNYVIYPLFTKLVTARKLSFFLQLQPPLRKCLDVGF